MSWFTGLLVFVIIWWLVLFAVLPWGVRPPTPEEMEPGQMQGAPHQPRILLKMAVTTVIAGVLWVGVYFLIVSDLITFRGALE